MRSVLRSLMLGMLSVSCLMPKAAQADMLSYMQSIGVPNPLTNDVLFFGWNVIAPPPNNAQVDIDALDFGLAMFQVGSQLRFAFVNADSSVDSAIAGIYFDDGSTNENGVYFDTSSFVGGSPGASFTFGNSNPPPWNLPEGGNLDPDFEVTDTISAVRSGNADTGINALPEYLILGYTYVGSYGFNDVVSNLLNNNIRIGMHVTGINNVTSDSFIWTPYLSDTPPPPGPLAPPVVPVPAAAGLGVLGMAIVGIARHKTYA